MMAGPREPERIATSLEPEKWRSYRLEKTIFCEHLVGNSFFVKRTILNNSFVDLQSVIRYILGFCYQLVSLL